MPTTSSTPEGNSPPHQKKDKSDLSKDYGNLLACGIFMNNMMAPLVGGLKGEEEKKREKDRAGKRKEFDFRTVEKIHFPEAGKSYNKNSVKLFFQIRNILALSFIFLIPACGGSGATNEADEAEEAGTGEEINTDKLVGTPFEGYETGDEFGWSYFKTGQYRTETVDYVPIPIFLAYFTSSEEETIEEGIAIANEGAGFEAFEMVDAWQDDARVIYKVDSIYDPDSGISEEYFENTRGKTSTTSAYYEDKTDAGTIVTDWIIELREDGIDFWIVAHEMGHAFGLSHALIDYENDTTLDSEPNSGLEENSLMQGDVFPSDPALTDYNYMMQMQGELLLRNIGLEGICCH